MKELQNSGARNRRSGILDLDFFLSFLRQSFSRFRDRLKNIQIIDDVLTRSDSLDHFDATAVALFLWRESRPIEGVPAMGVSVTVALEATEIVTGWNGKKRGKF